MEGRAVSLLQPLGGLLRDYLPLHHGHGHSQHFKRHARCQGVRVAMQELSHLKKVDPTSKRDRDYKNVVLCHRGNACS